ncbi:hypothetical protein WMF45_39100 [Sorangium sp. So ce448]|uniref:hypothetical protein n=1 Tax=Sorangium sp. So ce448 TaxID=3133314 RepID=UPI003F6389C8
MLPVATGAWQILATDRAHGRDQPSGQVTAARVALYRRLLAAAGARPDEALRHEAPGGLSLT